MEEFAQGTGGGIISLLFGHPDPATLMTTEFQEAIQTVASQPQSYRALQYGNEQGTLALIGYLVDKLNREQGLSLTGENVMITAGSTGAVDMIARLYAKPNGLVIVEAPSYADTLHVFRDHQIELFSVPMDEHGLVTTELEKLLARLQSENRTVNLLYTIPNFHNPTGITASVERRQEVVRLSGQYGFMVVEDDVYRDLAFQGKVPPSYYALNGGQQTISIGSFSKTLAPGLRLGWIVGTRAVIENSVNSGVMQMGGGANPFAAQIVAEYCCAGHLETHIARLRRLYEERCAVMLAALERHMPTGVTWTHPAGGYFVWVYLPDTIDALDVKQAALERGVVLAAGNGFFVNPADGKNNLRLAFSFASLDDIEKAVEILGQVICSL
jgi:2-aminoadipate transaminase